MRLLAGLLQLEPCTRGNQHGIGALVQVHEKYAAGATRILYVDDDEDLAVTEQKMLQSLGYDVIATTSSVEALRRFSEAPDQFDLIITDQTMPHMTGTELATEILRIRPGIPIILCSGYSFSSDGSITLEEASAIGIRELLPKPADSAEMVWTIRRVLGENRNMKSRVFHG